MSELPNSSEQAQVSNGQPSSAETVAQQDNKQKLWQKLMSAACVALALLLLLQWWSSYSEIGSLREELARRLQVGDSTNTEAKQLASSAQEGIKDLQAKVAALEARQAETQSQQLALAQMYQDMSKNRDDWALAEVEQVLSTAAQQLQLSGNVQGALIALQNADRSLARLDRPQFVLVRRAIARDIDKLRALPNVDVTGIALRLDSVISQIDKLPLYADEKPVVAAVQPKVRAAERPKTDDSASAAKTERNGVAADWWQGVQNKWQSLSSEIWGEFRQLIRVRSVDEPDALMLSPNQAYFIRENMKLRLLNARMALLSRNEATFRSDIVAAQDAVGKYFDTLAKQTQAVQALLKQVQGSDLVIQMPALESLNAINSHKSKG
ncbi:MAG: uroporphyrin-III methyltransferase [Burkholderiaceae bacterium]|nr:uroporphyrin-III methyltransferase [Burkholderiaceae bacterium]